VIDKTLEMRGYTLGSRETESVVKEERGYLQARCDSGIHEVLAGLTVMGKFLTVG